MRKPGQTINWSPKQFEAGSYFVQIIQNNKIVTRKLVVQ
ncbi:MAG: T9SS type A sorting domain-containing protein [Saprospiraceae bacterium]|nr:T9SS type A sorting domain-containing protein [Saprospiraceae bacterium]